MATTPAEQSLGVKPAQNRGLWAIAARRLLRRPKAVIAIALLAILYASGIFANVIAPYDYNHQDVTQVRQAPSTQHLLGTDYIGRDIFSRLVFSMRTSLILTVVSVITGTLLIGLILGLLAGYYGRWVDTLISRVGEVFMAFPHIFLMIIIAATIRPRVLDMIRNFEDSTGITGLVRWGIVDYLVVFGALAAFSWVGMARLVRGQILYLKETQFVDAARASGASVWRIMVVHLLPNALPPIIVAVSLGFGSVAAAEATLSFLGIGIQPPIPSLGRMIGEGQNLTILRNQPWIILPPVIVLMVIIFAWNLLGDALNDVLNPRTR
ncbi:MAG: ABC transporter permease [Dehalococcoidia bacterium]|nr:ABC transporter permease [Dehalococcoidia bacterium]